MANPWTKFFDLIKEEKKIIAVVISTDNYTKKIRVQEAGTGVYVYVDSNGATYSVGSYVFVTNNVVTGQAPDIRSFTEELLS